MKTDAESVVRQQEMPPRKLSILETSALLFAEQGFDRTTVRELAKALDLQSGSIFHYYGDKRSILVDVIREGTVRTAAAVDARLEGLKDPRERLEALIHTHIETLLGEARTYSLVSLLEWNRLTPDEQAAIAPVRDAYEQTWASVVNAAVKAKLLPRDELLRLYLLGTCNSPLLWYRPGTRLSPSEIADRFVAIALAH